MRYLAKARESNPRAEPSRLEDADYAALAEWRHALRRFLRASEQFTRTEGVSPTQYQLLLFIRGSPGRAPTIAELAERLQIQHQSAVGLVDRCENAGLVRRRRDPANGRRVLVETTRRGASLLRRLAAVHFETIERLGRAFFPPLPRGRRHRAPANPGKVPGDRGGDHAHR